MPILITEIRAEILDNFTGDLYFFSSLSGQVQGEDYIRLGAFIAYLQNLTKVDTPIEYLTKPLNFGLKNQYNVTEATLEISY